MGRLEFLSNHDLLKILSILELDYSKRSVVSKTEYTTKYSLDLYESYKTDTSKIYLRIDFIWEVRNYNNDQFDLSHIAILKLTNLDYVDSAMVIEKDFDQNVLIRKINREGTDNKEHSYYESDPSKLINIIINYYINLIDDSFSYIKRAINIKYISYEAGLDV